MLHSQNDFFFVFCFGSAEEDVEDRWYEWREWLAPQIQSLAFFILKTVVQKQKKLEDKKLLDKEKLF